MKVVVLGSTGMVGGYVSRYLSQAHEIITPGRSVVDAGSPRWSDLIAVVDADYVVNCIGVFGAPAQQMLCVNALFPRELQKACSRAGGRLIHVSTDGVFRGDRGKYTEDDSPDADDLYGISKALGEPEGAMTLRTSLVGLGGRHSLFDSVISERRFSGFQNHMWNGMTVVEFARCCGDIIDRDLFSAGVFHVFSETLSKEELIKMFIEEMNIQAEVEGANARHPVNRVLVTTRALNHVLSVRPIRVQLEELAAQQ